MLFDYLAAAIPLLGTLIFVHELGHFLAAKFCGVRVLKFSLGFGSPIGIGRFRMRWVRNGTEYVVAWFPLGGFVRMLGELMPGGEAELADAGIIDARPDEFLNAKPTWQKLLISFAGPFMNLALPVVAFVAVLWIGVARPTAVVGMVERGSPAAEVGLLPGDRLVAINRESVFWWQDVADLVSERVSGVVTLEVLRDDEPMRFEVPIETRSILDEFGAPKPIGWIGLGSRRLPTLIGVPAADRPAGLAGLRSGDRVTHVGDLEVADYRAFKAAYEGAGGASVVLQLLRFESGSLPSAQPSDELAPLSLEVPALGSLEDLGVISATILVQLVSEGRPAERAGLMRGDLLLAVDGRPTGSFESFRNTVQTSGGRPLEITYGRDGLTETVTIQPELRQVQGPLAIEGMTEDIYQIGISHALASLPGEEELDRVRNPLIALPRAVEMTLDITKVFLVGIGKLISGEVGTDKLAGPIGIAEIARKSLDLGWQAYLSTMILISINLGIVNLLPIPILDGGQMLIYAIEGVKGSAISFRTREYVQQAGLVALMMLMALAFWNDLSRHWSQFVEWINTAL